MVVRQHIDTHVHFRDQNQLYKFTIKQGMKLANSQGVVAVCDMPNTDPPLTSNDAIVKRLRIAQDLSTTDGYYVYGGVTTDYQQLKGIVSVHKENPRVVGLKMYAGSSVGNLGIVDPKDHLAVYKKLVELEYDGVLAVHCEKESKFRNGLWNPKKPCTWNLQRPPEAEIESIDDQIRFAIESGFKGTLHITHISTPEGVRKVNKARQDLKIICGITPHHLRNYSEQMFTEDSINLKVNPPIRDFIYVQGLVSCLKNGMIDVVETDHAPHTKEEKTRPPYMSGIRSLDNYEEFVGWLFSIGMSEKQVHDLTYGNARKYFVKIFGKN